MGATLRPVRGGRASAPGCAPRRSARREGEPVSVQVVPGTANAALATGVAAALGVAAVSYDLQRFPDGELRPTLGHLRGEDVYVVQPTGPPVNEHLVELLLLLDACRRAGAARVTAVVPYFGYARQDRRSRSGEAVGARVVADALRAVHADRLVVVDPHTAALEAISAVPCDMLSAVPVLAAALRPTLTADAVLVAADLGAVKLAERYASHLGRQVAVVRKTRLSGEAVRAHEVVGDVRDRPTVIVDDMISTGATIEAAIGVLRAAGATPKITVAATHGPLVAEAADRIAALGVRNILVTDTLPGADSALVHHCSVADLLADAIRRLAEHRPLDELLLRT